MSDISPESAEIIYQIVYQMEDAAERCEATRRLMRAEELLQVAHGYNWDDGFDLLCVILEHPACDLGLALTIFDIAAGIFWITDGRPCLSVYLQDTYDFRRALENRIREGRYTKGSICFRPELTKVQVYKARKAGVPEIFVTPLE
jgi:hypothetical protein